MVMMMMTWVLALCRLIYRWFQNPEEHHQITPFMFLSRNSVVKPFITTYCSVTLLLQTQMHECIALNVEEAICQM
jgi:hypothetical protein